ncbi:hypothetical protein J3R82DRAFT_6825 [Butyriboletus roseoflavus]|nr:hypothetical protein J3R82DRAFT_6825 [Butyriboletus roseoflavus]
MSTEMPNPLPDVVASTSDPQPPTHPPPKPSTSPPFADTVVRPFTSQGGTFGSPLQPLAYTHAPPLSSDRPSTAHVSPADPPNAKFGPYISASARTSYTRVDVDSSPAPVYPPLPPLPTAFAVQDVPGLSAAAGPTIFSATTTITTTTPTPDAPTNGAQTLSTEPPIPQTPQVSLTFLLVSGLRKTQSFDPETTIGRVKELVWNAWPARDADWQDERPPAPSYLRILYLGKILQDDDTLLRVGFPTSLPSDSNVTPSIVHLSIRPYALPSDDPALKKKRLSVAIGRRLSTVGVGPGGRGNVEHPTEGEPARRGGCCTGCTIC